MTLDAFKANLRRLRTRTNDLFIPAQDDIVGYHMET